MRTFKNDAAAVNFRALLLLSIFLAVSVYTPAHGLDTKGIFEKSRESVVLVMSFDKAGQPLVIGSGFFVDDGYTVVTNHHVIEGAASVKIKPSGGGAQSISRVVGIDGLHDLVLLKAPAAGPALSLSSREPAVGEDVIAIGNPQGLEGTLSVGVISGIRQAEGSTYYQITAPISPGSSGGPIIDEIGAVLGVSTFYVDGGQNLNFAVPAQYILALLESPVDKPISAAVASSKPDKTLSKGHDRVRIADGETTTSTVTGSVVNGTDGGIKNIRFMLTFHNIDVDLTGGYVQMVCAKDVLHYMLIEVPNRIPTGLGVRFERHDKNLERGWCIESRLFDYEIDSTIQTSIPKFE